MLYILLDIDGTLLPSHTANSHRPTLTIQLKITDAGIPLTFYADIVREFQEISQLQNCEVVMCTSWDETSLEIAKELGVKSDSYLVFVSENPAHWYKWDSIVNFCQTHPQDKVILCDDLASPQFTRHKPRNLVKIFQPSPADGLTLKDLKKIRKFVKKVVKKL